MFRRCGFISLSCVLMKKNVRSWNKKFSTILKNFSLRRAHVMSFNKGNASSWNKMVSIFSKFSACCGLIFCVLRRKNMSRGVRIKGEIATNGRIQGGEGSLYLSYYRTLLLSATTFIKRLLPYWKMWLRCSEAAPSELRFKKIPTDFFSKKIPATRKKLFFCTYDIFCYVSVCDFACNF